MASFYFNFSFIFFDLKHFTIFSKGMFTFMKEANCYWFTTSSSKDMLSEYHLIGVVIKFNFLLFKLKGL